jgi:hypothetical protein
MRTPRCDATRRQFHNRPLLLQLVLLLPAMPPVFTQNSQRKVPVNISLIKRQAEVVLKILKLEDYNLSLWYANRSGERFWDIVASV